ncbi:hypothetical protein OTK49_21650 [Vibrio coralliirubri]|uniref:hypothetical protein n=1 Tax=Vibrio coralliirubri TaxID=1516159 RepID=UPI0022839FAB|nr:hypothetical protein [Vibrio coralliirubri]MCY9865128.1 hypothetical protein [Vibrio coralliirubri]
MINITYLFSCKGGRQSQNSIKNQLDKYEHLEMTSYKSTDNSWRYGVTAIGTDTIRVKMTIDSLDSPKLDQYKQDLVNALTIAKMKYTTAKVINKYAGKTELLDLPEQQDIDYSDLPPLFQSVQRTHYDFEMNQAIERLKAKKQENGDLTVIGTLKELSEFLATQNDETVITYKDEGKVGVLVENAHFFFFEGENATERGIYCNIESDSYTVADLKDILADKYENTFLNECTLIFSIDTNSIERHEHIKEVGITVTKQDNQLSFNSVS